MLDTPHRILMLGQFSLRRQDKTLHHFRTRKAAGLLAYLACFPHRPHSREELTEMLWPDALPEAARQNFRQALSTLRACLEPDVSQRGLVLVSDTIYVALNARAVTTDTEDFQKALNRAEIETWPDKRAAHLADAAALYGGELLPGFYEEWVLRERERLRALYMRALEPLWQYQEARNNWTAALEYALRGVKSDACHEAAHLTAIRCYFETGQAARAQECYDAYTRNIQQELGISPSPALRALIQSRLHPSATPKTTKRAAAPHKTTGKANVVRHEDAAHPGGAVQWPAPKTPALWLSAPNAASPAPAAPRLPLFLTTFFGRDAEIQRICFLLAPSASIEKQPSKIENPIRLLTLTGPGGGGKTRLAVEAGLRLRAHFQDAVYFVGLADVPHAAHIASSVADALCRAQANALGPSASCDPLEQIAACLASSPALLILDNYEHLVHDGAGFVLELLQCCPRLTCLVTSRSRLNVSGERALPLRPLSIPGPNSGIETLRDNAAIRLFIDRAQAARPDFRLTPHNAAHIAAVCAGLEGLPLALELAAARIGTFSLAEMRRQIEYEDGGLRLLVSRHRDTHHRHHNLNATIEWSFGLLSPALQRFFTRLSLLHGTWTADAAQAVTQYHDTHIALEELCQASLVVVADAEQNNAQSDADQLEQAASFRMLEMLRQWGRRRLGQAEYEDAACRHALHYTRHAEKLATNAQSEAERAWREQMRQDEPNLRAALDWCFGPGGDRTLGARLCLALVRYWHRRSQFSEARRYLECALQPGPVPLDGAMQARLWKANALFAGLLNDYPEAAALTRRSVDFWRARQNAIEQDGDEQNSLEHNNQQNSVELASALHNLGHFTWCCGNHQEAETYHREAADLHRAHANKNGLCRSFNCLGAVIWSRGDVENAKKHWMQALKYGVEADDEACVVGVQSNLAMVAVEEADYAAAERYNAQTLAYYCRQGDTYWEAYRLQWVGHVAALQGRWAEARACFDRARATLEQVQDRSGLTGLARAEGRMAFAQGDTNAARQCMQQALRLALTFTFQGGQTLFLEELVLVTSRFQTASASVRILAACMAQRDRCRFYLRASEHAERAACLDAAKAVLGETAFTQAWTEGQNMDWNEVVGLALTL